MHNVVMAAAAKLPLQAYLLQRLSARQVHGLRNDHTKATGQATTALGMQQLGS